MARRGRLEGRSALIVGGTGGIGSASAGRFIDEGARVVVTGVDPSGPPGTSGVSFVALDLADATDEIVASTFDRALAMLGGRIDILLHVAGISGRRYGDGPLPDCTDAGWDTVMAVNARGVFLTNREAARRMLGQGRDNVGLRGSVVNVGSVLATRPAPGHFATIAYAASKGAVRSLTIAAASRHASEGVRFNLIEPGLIDTPMAARAVGDPAVRRYLSARQPIADGPGLAADVAEAAVYLSEPASRFVAGAILAVDGGWSVSDGELGADS